MSARARRKAADPNCKLCKGRGKVWADTVPHATLVMCQCRALAEIHRKGVQAGTAPFAVQEEDGTVTITDAKGDFMMGCSTETWEIIRRHYAQKGRPMP